MKSTASGVLVVRGISAGIVGALIVAIADLLLNLPGRNMASLTVSLGILLPLGAATGFLPITMYKILGGNDSVNTPFDIWRDSDASRRSIWILVYGLTSIVGAKILYTATHFFAVGFHHPGLAAFALLLFLIAAAVTGGLIVPFMCRILENTVIRFCRAKKLLGRPIAPICFVAGATLGILLPPLLIGPNAHGPFGFIGQLDLDGAAIILLLILPPITLALTAWSRPISLRRLLPIFTVLMILAVTAPFAAGRSLRRSPNLRAAVETGTGLAAAFLRFTERGTDR